MTSGKWHMLWTPPSVTMHQQGFLTVHVLFVCLFFIKDGVLYIMLIIPLGKTQDFCFKGFTTPSENLVHSNRVCCFRWDSLAVSVQILSYTKIFHLFIYKTMLKKNWNL